MSICVAQDRSLFLVGSQPKDAQTDNITSGSQRQIKTIVYASISTFIISWKQGILQNCFLQSPYT